MDDLETRMRGGLTQLVEPVSDLPELDAVVTRGRQLRARRRIGVVAGGAAALALVAGLGWAGTSLLHRADSPVVGTPSVSASASTTPGLVLPGTTDQVVFSDGPLVAELMATRVRVNATLLPGGLYSVEVAVVRGDRVDYQHTATNDGRSISWFQVTPKVIVGFVPHRLNWIQYFDKEPSEAFGSFGSDIVPFGQLDGTAVFRTTDFGGEYVGLRDYLWRGADGSYRDGEGSLAPSVALGHVTYYLSDRLGVLGSVSPSGGVSTLTVADGRPTYLTSWAESGEGRATTAALLPVGASQPDPKTAGKQAEVQTAELGGRVLVVVSATVRGTVDPMASLSYTDANGKLVTDKQ